MQFHFYLMVFSLIGAYHQISIQIQCNLIFGVIFRVTKSLAVNNPACA